MIWNLKKSVFIVLGLLLVSSLLPGQSFLLDSPEAGKRRLAIQFQHPAFKHYSRQTALSGLYEISYSTPLNRRWDIVAALPYMVYESKEPIYNPYWEQMEEVSEKGLGNLYLGVRHRLKSSSRDGFNLSMGAYLPTMSAEKYRAGSIGKRSDYCNYFRFVPRMLTFTGTAGYYRSLGDFFRIDVELGPALLVSTDPQYSDTALNIHYGLTLSADVGMIGLSAGYSGFRELLGDSEAIAESYGNVLIFGARLNRGGLRPGVFYKIYLDYDLRVTVKGILGISLAYVF